MVSSFQEVDVHGMTKAQAFTAIDAKLRRAGGYAADIVHADFNAVILACAERDNGLAAQIIAFEESPDRHGRVEPPDRETDIDHIIGREIVRFCRESGPHIQRLLDPCRCRCPSKRVAVIALCPNLIQIRPGEALELHGGSLGHTVMDVHAGRGHSVRAALRCNDTGACKKDDKCFRVCVTFRDFRTCVLDFISEEQVPPGNKQHQHNHQNDQCFFLFLHASTHPVVRCYYSNGAYFICTMPIVYTAITCRYRKAP